MKITNKSQLLLLLITMVACNTALAEPVDSLAHFFSPQGETVTSASYPTQRSDMVSVEGFRILPTVKAVH